MAVCSCQFSNSVFSSEGESGGVCFCPSFTHALFYVMESVAVGEGSCGNFSSGGGCDLMHPSRASFRVNEEPDFEVRKTPLFTLNF